MFVAEGDRLIETALSTGIDPAFTLHHQDYDGPILKALQNVSGLCLPVSHSLFIELSSVETPPGVIAVFPEMRLDMPHSPQRTLILDAIREPGNLGAIMRTALAAGVDCLLLAPECADPYNPKAVRAATGAHFQLPLQRRRWDEISNLLQDVRIYLADSSAAQNYAEIDWTLAPWALIVSNEAHGPSQPARDLAIERLGIPMAAGVNSLNVAAATAIILFEAFRQAAN